MPEMKDELEKALKDGGYSEAERYVRTVWFHKGWLASEVAAQQVAEADAHVCPHCGTTLTNGECLFWGHAQIPSCDECGWNGQRHLPSCSQFDCRGAAQLASVRQEAQC